MILKSRGEDNINFTCNIFLEYIHLYILLFFTTQLKLFFRVYTYILLIENLTINIEQISSSPALGANEVHAQLLSHHQSRTAHAVWAFVFNV